MTREHAYKLREMLHKASVSLPDEDALEAVEFFPFWKPNTHYEREDGEEIRVRDPEDGFLYRLIPKTHDSLPNWPPRLVPAIWTRVEEPGQGDSPSNPIPYDNNMELVEGKYYSQNGVTYHCWRSTGVPVYNNLADLVGLYVEVVA